MNREIFRIALPSIVSNLALPLLGLVDTAIVGHLGSPVYIGAIAVGGIVFSMVYWIFGFLRMGTGGLTAQAYGAGEQHEVEWVLWRSLILAVVISLLLVCFHPWLGDGAFWLMDAGVEVECWARIYFGIVIFGAPAVLCGYSFSGWFLGMQNARFPMWIAILQNVGNILLSLLFVLVFEMGLAGVAAGTLLSQYIGLFLAVFLWWKYYRPISLPSLNVIFRKEDFQRFFSVSCDIFLRTFCLIAVTVSFTSLGASQGDLVLAANSVLMHFFIVFSYFMDGFAFAGEAVGGRFYGANNPVLFKQLIRTLFLWGTIVAMVFSIVYGLGGEWVLSVLTDNQEVLAVASEYLPFVVFIPWVSFSAFLLDGLFIGTACTRPMLWAMLCASVVYFLLCYLFFENNGNSLLWTAFLIYLGLRGVVLYLLYFQIWKRPRQFYVS